MTTITIDRAVVEQALEALTNCNSEHGHRCNRCDSEVDEGGKVAAALRAALAQQAEPLNLRDPAVQKRLATQWGYVPAAQAEPVEPVEPVAVVATQSDVWRGYNGQWAPPGEPIKMVQMLRDLPLGTLLYTAPPHRKPLTKEEILRAFYAAEKSPMSIRHGLSVVESARIVERAHGIGETK